MLIEIGLGIDEAYLQQFEVVDEFGRARVHGPRVGEDLVGDVAVIEVELRILAPALHALAFNDPRLEQALEEAPVDVLHEGEPVAVDRFEFPEQFVGNLYPARETLSAHRVRFLVHANPEHFLQVAIDQRLESRVKTFLPHPGNRAGGD